MKRILISFLSLALPLSAAASSLSIDNQAPSSLTIKLNGACIQPVIQRSSKQTYAETTINKACDDFSAAQYCAAEVYNSSDCSGPLIAEFVLDKNIGIHSEMPDDKSYWVSSTGTAYPDSIFFIGLMNR